METNLCVLNIVLIEKQDLKFASELNILIGKPGAVKVFFYGCIAIVLYRLLAYWFMITMAQSY